jgi:hypothetical protein
MSEFQNGKPMFPLWGVLFANILVFGLSLPFYWVPEGTPIRPMAWAFWVFIIAAAAIVSIIVAIPLLRKNQGRWWVWLAILLSVTPYPLGVSMLHHASHLRHLFLEP